jgi:hypothetical protein
MELMNKFGVTDVIAEAEEEHMVSASQSTLM